MFKFKTAGQEVKRHKIQFKKARSPRETLNDLDEYIRAQGTEPIEWLAREVRRWGEFSYEELEQAILDGRLDELIDWQSRYAELINGTLSLQWASAMTAAAAKATHGQIVLYDSDPDVHNWLKRRGGELITVLSEESKRAVANVILYGQSGLVNPKQIARQVRPLIGLNARQAQANINYRERIYQQYISNGVNPVTAAEKADKAALKYAGKQHRFRAETITHTEMAFAYNQGADVGVKRAVKQGLMGKCEMVWTTAGTNRVCPRCLALKDTVVGHTDESGVTLPPLHPRCRCAIMYREVEIPAVEKPKKPNGSVGGKMGADDIPKWPPRNKANIISKDEYAKLRSIAEIHGIALSGVKKFDGSAKTIEEVLNTLITLQEKFPAVQDERYKLTLSINKTMGNEDFAITHGKIISLNEDAYRNVEILEMEYKKAMESGWFVKGTDYRAIVHHEFGHVIADVYKIDSLKIACEITGMKPFDLFPWLYDNLSQYSAGYLDGGEIISEVFADMSTGNPCEFSRKFYDKIWELTRGV